MNVEIIDFASRSQPFVYSRAIQAGNDEFRKGNYKKALEHYTKAIDLNSEDPKAYLLRSSANLKSGYFEQAYADAKKAMNLGDSGIEIKIVMAEIIRSVRNIIDPEFWAPWVRTAVYLEQDGPAVSCSTMVIGPLIRK